MASKIYQASETSTVWTSSGGDKLLDMGGQVLTTARCGAYLDLGASPRADWYEAVILIGSYATAPLVTEHAELRFTQSLDGTLFDGQPTTAPTATVEGVVTIEQTLNMILCAAPAATAADTTHSVQGRGLVKLTGRYVAPVVINWSIGDAFDNDGTTHSIVLTPLPYEGQ
jgi:hypothetical protein